MTGDNRLMLLQGNDGISTMILRKRMNNEQSGTSEVPHSQNLYDMSVVRFARQIR